MAYAESQNLSGTAPCVAEDGPSEHEPSILARAHHAVFRRKGGTAVEDTVTPPREARSTDLTRGYVPMPFIVGIVSIALAIAAAVWTIRTEVQLLSQRVDFEARSRAEDKDAIMQALKTLEAKIDAARNGAAALSTMQDNERLRQEITKLRGR